MNRIVAGRHGYFLVSQYDEYIGGSLIKYGEYGELEWQILDQLIAPGMTVIEVGANIGSHTVSLAKKVGRGGRVIAIEPQRVIQQYLSANIALNTLDNVECIRAGAGAENGQMIVPRVDYFAHANQNFGSLSLVAEGEGESVAVIRLDDIIADKTIQVIKIDVEGMEADVLRGAAGLIAANRPVIYVENDRPANSDELVSLLWSMNYRAYWHLPPLFNPDNFFGDGENIYASTVSINLLCIALESDTEVTGFEEVTQLGFHPLTVS